MKSGNGFGGTPGGSAKASDAGHRARTSPRSTGCVATHPRYVSASSANPPPTYAMPMLGASIPTSSTHS